MPPRRKTAAFILITCTTLAGNSRALLYEESDLLQLSLQELMQVPITGPTRSQQSIATVPAAVTVFTHQEIERLGVDFLHELLPLVPGYQSFRNADDALSSTYDSRGRRNSSQSREVVLLIDGRPFNDPRTGATNTSVRQLPLQQFERVEVIRGPGSAVYGSNAFTGIINLISRKNVNEVSVASGSFDRAQVQALASATQGDWQLNAFVFGDRDNGDDYNVLDGAVGNYQRVSTQDPRSLQHVDVQLQFADIRVQMQHRRDHAEDFYIGGGVNNDFRHYTGEHNQLTLVQDIQWNNAFSSELQADFVQTLLDINIQFLPAGALAAYSDPTGSTAPMLGKANLDGERQALRIHNAWKIDSARDLQFGAQWSRDDEVNADLATNYDLLQFSSRTIPFRYYGNFDHSYAFGQENSNRRVSAYGQYQQSWNQRTHLTLGLRQDDSSFDSYLSPRLALVHQLSDQHSLKLLYGEAFRSPSLTETGTTNNPAIVGNPDLDHEVVKTWDLIWVMQWQKTQLITGVFHNHYDAPIIAANVDSTRTYINGDDENSQGAEVELSQQINAEWLMSGTWTFLDELPDSAYKEANHFGAVTLNYQHAAWNWNVGAIYQGRREMLLAPAPGTRQTLDEYWLVHTKLSYVPAHNWQIYLQAKNALNEDYLTPADGNTLPQGVPPRGRQLLFGIRYTL